MEQKTKNKLFWTSIIICIGLFICFILTVAFYPLFNSDNVLITGKVIKVEAIGNDIYMLNVTFDNNETYKIYNGGYNEITDFTMHSKWIIHLVHEHTLFGILQKDYWTITSIVQVPE